MALPAVPHFDLDRVETVLYRHRACRPSRHIIVIANDAKQPRNIAKTASFRRATARAGRGSQGRAQPTHR
jgi:hypothetical protein